MSKVLTDQIEKRTGGTAMDLPSTGKWPTANIADDAVTATQIADDAITADKILADSITTVKILNDNVTTAKILDNNVTLAKLSDGTQGGTIYYGASGAPTELAAGTAGQVLQTQGAAANPTWAAAAADTGGWEMITRTQVGGSNLAEIDFTGMVAGYQYMYSWNGIASSNAGAEDFAMRVSTDGGTSYATSAYVDVCRQYYNTLSSNVFTNTAYFPLSENQDGQTVANGNNGRVYCYNVGSASLNFFMDGANTQRADASNPLRTNSYGGYFNTAASVTAVRFYFTTGNILASTTAYITQYKQKIT